jgi:phytoene/squalene synthetase
MLVRGVLTNREHPDLAHLRSIEDPEEFVWAILPHAARSFAATILALPPGNAKVAAVAYLYCRMLDTFEDLYPDASARPALLAEFGARLAHEPPAAAAAISDRLARDDRDRVHLLLVARCGLVDEVFATLPPPDRDNVRLLVSGMAAGMALSARQFADQDGVLISDEQLMAYCDTVIGEPVLFTMRLLIDVAVDEKSKRDAMDVAEMIQLANITRDIERDLERGIAYNVSLRPYLAGSGDEQRTTVVRAAREHMILMALSRAPAYRRLMTRAGFRPISEARGAAVMMLLFTDRYYRSAMAAIGRSPWKGPNLVWSLYISAALAAVWPAWARWVIARTERNFLRAAVEIAGSRPRD